jgi:hypothetical protein
MTLRLRSSVGSFGAFSFLMSRLHLVNFPVLSRTFPRMPPEIAVFVARVIAQSSAVLSGTAQFPVQRMSRVPRSVVPLT